MSSSRSGCAGSSGILRRRNHHPPPSGLFAGHATGAARSGGHRRSARSRRSRRLGAPRPRHCRSAVELACGHCPAPVHRSSDVRNVATLDCLRQRMSRSAHGRRGRQLAYRTAKGNARRAAYGTWPISDSSRGRAGNEPVGGVEARAPPRHAAFDTAQLREVSGRPTSHRCDLAGQISPGPTRHRRRGHQLRLGDWRPGGTGHQRPRTRLRPEST